MNKKKLSILTISLLVLTLVLAGCQKSTPTVKEAKEDLVEGSESNIKNEIVYGIWSAPTGIFNPVVSDSLYDTTINNIMYESLLELDKDLSLKGLLVESYKVSEDNLKITFKLKDGIKWHDGKKLTAEDVKFTFESLARPGYEANNASFLQAVTGAQDFMDGKSQEVVGIKVLDEKTLELNFDSPYAPALTQLGTTPIIAKHVWEDKEIGNWTKETELLQKPIGTGPYKMEEYKDGQFVKLVKNSEYHRGEVKTNNLIFKVSNEDTAQAELINGSIDIAGVSSSKQKDIDYLKENSVEVIDFPNSNIQYMGTNLRNELLQDKNIRQAMAYGLDRKLMVDELIDGNGVVINAPMVPSLWSYPEDGVLNEYTRDVAKAKELLKKSGYEDSNKDGFVDKNGENLKLTLTYPSGDKAREMAAPIIQSQLKEVGIEIELEMMEFSSLMEKVVGNHEFDLYLMANTLSEEPDPKPTWYSTAASDEKGVFGWNISGFKNKDVDKLLDQGLATLDQGERKEIYTEFAKIMNDELPWIPLYVPNVIQAYNKDLKNYEPGTFRTFQNVQDWYIEVK